MATKTLVKHGTFAGYRAEQKAGKVCERCRAASRVYNQQFSKTNKAKGVKYSTTDVIDGLYVPGKNPIKPDADVTQPDISRQGPRQDSGPTPTPGPMSGAPDAGTESRTGPSVRDRFADLLGGARNSNESYVITDDAPDYIHPVEPDPEPDKGDWSAVKPDEYVITEQGLKLIESNLATYLSVLGITLEMIDPYCGPILAQNFDNIVYRWTKVIGRYPKAAQLFLSEEGGTIMTWIGALQATWPVLKAVYDHHLAKTDKDNKPRFNRDTVDATMPPMAQPEYDYSVG